MEICAPSRAHRAFASLCCEKTAVLHAPNRAHRGFRARTGRANNPVDSTAIGAAFCARASRADNPRGSFPEPPQFPLPFSGNLRYNSFRIGQHPPETHRGG